MESKGQNYAVVGKVSNKFLLGEINCHNNDWICIASTVRFDDPLERVNPSSPVKVRPYVQEPLDHGGVLGHAAHVQHILPVILVREVNVIEEEWKVHQKPLGQVEVNSGALQEAHMEHCLTNTSPGQLKE